ncbi:MAG TPA: imidazoleglycerol-phosphate dehydratase HisB [Dehalococcoidales bacterium]|nr:imidazoleglycerol-phosphate dehydratase HisB [Dehalococcoidales bacterium]
MDLVDRVVQYQKREGYTDRQMADSIGCSRPTYLRTRAGKIPAGGLFLRGAEQLLSRVANRSAIINRKTKETDIRLELNVDGSGKSDINTGIKMFDHLLSQVACHGAFDIKLTATGDDQHHLAEDVAICLGKAFGEALGEKRGIVRMADASVPMDDSLAMVALDISGRGYTRLQVTFAENDMIGFSTDLIRHFLESFAFEARLNLYATVDGVNDHHKAEALFKALGRALDTATRIDERIGGVLPTTKDLLER